MEIIYISHKIYVHRHTHILFIFLKKNASWKNFQATNMHANDCMYVFIEIMYWVVFVRA